MKHDGENNTNLSLHPDWPALLDTALYLRGRGSQTHLAAQIAPHTNLTDHQVYRHLTHARRLTDGQPFAVACETLTHLPELLTPLAAAAGYALTPLPRPTTPDPNHAAANTLTTAANLVRTLLDALADGHITPTELTHIETAINATRQATNDLDYITHHHD